MVSKRRMGPENSATRALLMDGAEAVMLEQGYAALTSRSVAERVGLKKYERAYQSAPALDPGSLAVRCVP